MTPNMLGPNMAADPQRFRPQWVYFTPSGVEDVESIVSFKFRIPATGVLQRGLPIQLDDDADFILRGLYIPLDENPAGYLCRLYDGFGNALQASPCFQMGGLANGGRGFGFPVDQEIFYRAGGVALMDLAISSNGSAAFLQHVHGADVTLFTANIIGTAGALYSIQYINPAAANVPLSVAVAGNAVQVTLATNGASALISTVLQVIAGINATPAAAALLTASLLHGTGASTEVAFGPTSLAGGTFGTAADFSGALLGIKRRALNGGNA